MFNTVDIALVYYPLNNIRVSFHFVEIDVFNFTLKPIKYNIIFEFEYLRYMEEF